MLFGQDIHGSVRGVVSGIRGQVYWHAMRHGIGGVICVEMVQIQIQYDGHI